MKKYFLLLLSFGFLIVGMEHRIEAATTSATKIAQKPEADEALLDACESGDLKAATRAIAEGANINTRDAEDKTPLLLACIKGDFDIANLLLENGANNIDLSDADGNTPLILACSNVGTSTTVKLLLENGANVHAVNNKGNTPLMYACAYARLTTTVDLLLQYGANIHAVNNKGNTPLIFACNKGAYSIVTILLAKGADVNASDKEGKTPLMIAATESALYLAENDKPKESSTDPKTNRYPDNLLRPTIIKTLLKNGALFTSEQFDEKTIARLQKMKQEIIVMANKDLLAACKKHYSLAYQNDVFAAQHAITATKNAIKEGADVNTSEADGITPLMYTCRNGNPDILKILLDTGADVNAVDKNGLTALMYACKFRVHKFINILLERGAKINAVDKDGWTPLMHACENKCIDAIKILLANKEVNVNAVDNDGWTPLISACANGNAHIVKMLLDRGADVNAIDKDGWTPLIHADESKSVPIAALLLGKGAIIPRNPSIKNKIFLQKAFNELYSPATNFFLRISKANGFADPEGVKVAQDTIDKGADINASDMDGKTPLIYACEFKNRTIIQLLLEHKVKIPKDLNEESKALIEAVQNKIAATKNATLLTACQNNDFEAAQQAINAGANVHTRDTKDRTPLMIASLSGSDDYIIKLLIQNGAEIEAVNKDGMTALMFACQNMQINAVKSLLKNNAHANAQDKNGMTPLMFACQNGNLDIVKILLDHGVKINAVNKEGKTALMIASENGNLEIANVLTIYDTAVKSLKTRFPKKAKDTTTTTPPHLLVPQPETPLQHQRIKSKTPRVTRKSSNSQ